MTLASASKDKTVILWTLNQERLAESASLWTLTLDELILRGCDWLKDYLKYNPNLDESDRLLCPSIKKD